MFWIIVPKIFLFYHPLNFIKERITICKINTYVYCYSSLQENIPENNSCLSSFVVLGIYPYLQSLPNTDPPPASSVGKWRVCSYVQFKLK